MPTTATRAELESLLANDVPYGDLTTDALGIWQAPGRMTFTARDGMVLALVEDAAAIIELAGCRVELHARSGDILTPAAPILVVEGPAAGLLRSWKVAQTLVETWSGVATAARAVVEAARSVAPHVAVACTRKHVPGTKLFAAAAVRAGGATMHRLGLSETILVFPEHLAFLGDRSLADVVARLRRTSPEKKLLIEVKTLDAALAAAAAGFDAIQAEKFPPAMIGELVGTLADLRPRPILAAAGGVKADNAADYARAGADVLVTSAPYLGHPRDVQVTITPSSAGK